MPSRAPSAAPIYYALCLIPNPALFLSLHLGAHIYTYWGDVQPDPVDDIPIPDPDMHPTIEDRLADMEDALAALMYGGEAV